MKLRIARTWLIAGISTLGMTFLIETYLKSLPEDCVSRRKSLLCIVPNFHWLFTLSFVQLVRCLKLDLWQFWWTVDCTKEGLQCNPLPSLLICSVHTLVRKKLTTPFVLLGRQQSSIPLQKLLLVLFLREKREREKHRHWMLLWNWESTCGYWQKTIYCYSQNGISLRDIS